MRSLHLFGLAALVRVVIIIYSEWQDRNMVVKYTDIDYEVFTDAARCVVDGSSPFDRATYRYTPLLAWLLVPNILWFKAFGKVLFALADLAIGVFIQRILRNVNPKMTSDQVNRYTALWLFNPIAINVSTRGNAESVVSVLVLWALDMLMEKQFVVAAIVYGISVHFKIYPILYGMPMFFYIGSSACPTRSKSLLSLDRMKFFVISASTFFLLTGIMYLLYGQTFLDEAYLYHIWRKDHRHSFSVYFYMLYLTSNDDPSNSISGAWFFVPQILVTLAFYQKYFKQIPFCIFLITLAFVAFNKVCTVQYFVWYFCLLPIVLPQCNLGMVQGIVMLAAFFGAQGIWLFLAYQLEFLGMNTFFKIWLAGLGFFGVNIAIIVAFVRSFRATSKAHAQ